MIAQVTTWSEEPSAASTFPKPKHPLSAYNLFFQLERKRILDGTDALNLPITPQDLQGIIVEHKTKGKRKHRKSHGKISFRELARTVAGRWKNVNAETRRVLDRQAAAEKQEYLKAMELWKKSRQEQTIAPEEQDPHQDLHQDLHQEQPIASTKISKDSIQMLEQLRNQILDQISQNLVFSSQPSLPALPMYAASADMKERCTLTEAVDLDVPPLPMDPPQGAQADALTPLDWQTDPFQWAPPNKNNNAADDENVDDDMLIGAIQCLTSSEADNDIFADSDLSAALDSKEMDALFAD